VVQASEATISTGETRLSKTEKVSYSFTDLAGNILYVTISTYILYFYTDVFKIPVAAAGTILLIARCVDAASAAVWGSIIDHTRTKWGQSRPYFLWLAVPFAIASFISFTAPDLSSTAKLWYAGATYVLAAGVIYTGIQTPITAILPNLTTDREERVAANSYRMVGGNLGAFVASSLVLPLVAVFGSGDERIGFMWTLALFGIVVVVLMLVAFRNLRERAVSVAKPVSFMESLRVARGNAPWMLIVVTFVIFWIAQADRNSIAVYYAKYNLGNEQLGSVFNGLQIIGIVAVIAIPFLVKLTSKTSAMLISLGVAAFGQAMMAFVGNNFPLVIASWIVGILGASVAIALPFAMIADTVDYGEWKTGIRAAGFLAAVGSAFCIQVGSGLGSFIPSKIMGAAGFAAGKPQTAESLTAIQFSFIWLPIIVYAVCALIMLFYYRYEKMEARIKRELAARAGQPNAV
jgi:GPH family glycoside/pentoside/hexuronide:cation symporter